MALWRTLSALVKTALELIQSIQQFNDPMRRSADERMAVHYKTAFVAAVQTSEDGKPRFMRLTPVAGFTKEAIKEWASKQSVQRPEFRWVNTMLGNLKRSLSGTYHAIGHAKYGARYLAEFAYRFNRRFDLSAMVPRLLRAAVTTKPHPLTVLRISEASN